MIRLLRKIRNKLLSDGKYTQYILYATGEIVLVMIGILLALQINNWNEKRVEKRKVYAHLINLKEALQDEIDRLENVQTINTFRFKSTNYIIKMAGYDPLVQDTSFLEIDSSFIWKSNDIPDTLDRNFLRLGFSWSHRHKPFSSNKVALDELKSTGMYTNIDKTLKESINDYYVQTDWLFSEGWETQQIDHSDKFHSYVRDEFGVLLIDPLASGLLFDQLQIDSIFVLRLNEIALKAIVRRNRAKEARDEAIGLIEKIDQGIPESFEISGQ